MEASQFLYYVIAHYVFGTKRILPNVRYHLRATSIATEIATDIATDNPQMIHR